MFKLKMENFKWNGIHIPFGRKTTNEEEAGVIHSHFRGQEVKLGEVKKWILIQSPFTFHSIALGCLEKVGVLSVHDPDGMIPRKGIFNANDVREGRHNSSNQWELTFTVEIIGDNLLIGLVVGWVGKCILVVDDYHVFFIKKWGERKMSPNF